MGPILESTNRITLRLATPADEAFELDLFAGTRWDELKLVDWNDIQKRTFLKMQFTARQQQYCLRYPTSGSELRLGTTISPATGLGLVL